MSPNPVPTPRYRFWLHGLVVLATALTFPLLLSGGSVSVYRVGMAVPDWPTTFGVNMFLYDMLNSSWGVQLEHSHRLLGSAVGLVCVAVFLAFLVAEPRRWLKGLAFAALVGVSLQGVLGGIRVLRVSTPLALLHGCTAELFFAFMVAFCVLSGRDWATPVDARPDPARLRRKTLVTLIMVYAQVVLGAWVRHYGDTVGLLVHAFFATTVWGHATAIAIRVLRRRSELPELAPSARAMLVLVTAQLALGVLSWWLLRPFDGLPHEVLPGQAAVRIAHQGLAAFLLAASIVLTLRTYRHLSPRGPITSGPVPAIEPLEAVA